MSDPQAKNETHDGTNPAGTPQGQGQVLDGPAIYEQTKAADRKKSRCRKLRNAPIWIEAFAALAIVVITGLYTHYASIQADQATIAANAAKSAADTAAKQLEMSERPWVDLQTSINGALEYNINGPLLPLMFRLVNTGPSAALATNISVFPVADSRGGDDTTKHLADTCNGATRGVMEMPYFGVALFPNHPFEQPMGIQISKEETEKASKLPPVGKLLLPSIAVCVGYRSTFNEHRVYHTAYILDLVRIDSKNKPDWWFTIGEKVTAAHLRLQCHPSNCITAD